MKRTYFVLFLLLSLAFPAGVSSQTPGDNVSIRVAVVDGKLDLKNVPKFALAVTKKGDAAFTEKRISTNFEGVATLPLSAGEYVVRSVSPLNFEEKSFAWEQTFVVKDGEPARVELSNDNAKLSVAEAAPGRRRVSEAAELFPTLSNGVVTIEGELAEGTGFIFDERGLVLTNHHVVEDTNDIRVRFDKKTAVRARLLAKDVDRDIAVLQINMSAFPGSLALKIADTKGTQPAILVGEHVFSIGSPANQDKILTTGIVSKIEERAIISDIRFGEGSAGGPLFNSVGEVVGITTFKVEERTGLNNEKKKDSGLAGVIRIEEAEALISQARTLAAAKGLPSAELMPYVPDGLFPIETIKAGVQSPQFSSKNYTSDVKNYQVRFMTPVYKFYMIEKDRIESLKIREKRNKDKGKINPNDMFQDLRVWSEYSGDLAPTVEIAALPETAPTGKSMALSAITNLTIGYSTPFDHRYKADFNQMKLLCDGKEVVPVRRTKVELARDLQNYYKTKKRFTYAGVYTYPFEMFAPGRCSAMELHVFSEEDLETPIVTKVTDSIKGRIWTDFQDYRTKIARK
jgi:S1-C subfamily serine protease